VDVLNKTEIIQALYNIQLIGSINGVSVRKVVKIDNSWVDNLCGSELKTIMQT
jgi:hypothetical protein